MVAMCPQRRHPQERTPRNNLCTSRKISHQFIKVHINSHQKTKVQQQNNHRQLRPLNKQVAQVYPILTRRKQLLRKPTQPNRHL